MTTAHYLRLIDGMRTKEFPLERVSSGSGISGPGYHTTFLLGEDERSEGDEETASNYAHVAWRNTMFCLRF